MIRPHVVRDALLWFKKFNIQYEDIILDFGANLNEVEEIDFPVDPVNETEILFAKDPGDNPNRVSHVLLEFKDQFDVAKEIAN